MNVTDDVRHHHTRCARDLARLRMLASDLGGVPLSPGAVRQVVQATSAVLAEAREAARTALTAGPASHRPSGRRPFLAARPPRLENAAPEAIASARAGDTSAPRPAVLRLGTRASADGTGPPAAR